MRRESWLVQSSHKQICNVASGYVGWFIYRNPNKTISYFLFYASNWLNFKLNLFTARKQTAKFLCIVVLEGIIRPVYFDNIALLHFLFFEWYITANKHITKILNKWISFNKSSTRRSLKKRLVFSPIPEFFKVIFMFLCIVMLC